MLWTNPVKLQRRGRFLAEVGRLGYGVLHHISFLVIGNRGLDNLILVNRLQKASRLIWRTASIFIGLQNFRLLHQRKVIHGRLTALENGAA